MQCSEWTDAVGTFYSDFVHFRAFSTSFIWQANAFKNFASPWTSAIRVEKGFKEMRLI